MKIKGNCQKGGRQEAFGAWQRSVLEESAKCKISVILRNLPKADDEESDVSDPSVSYASETVLKLDKISEKRIY
jgi:hypothetical protein